jgi:paraquat-inducible protein A
LPEAGARGSAELIAVNAAILASCALLITGLVLPILTLRKLLWIENTFSILSGIRSLAADGQLLLAGVILGFSVLLPAFKILTLWRVWNSRDGPRTRNALQWLHRIGRWSMLDVFVVAVLVASVKLGALASVDIHIGLYAFGCSVLLVMLISEWLPRRVPHRAD